MADDETPERRCFEREPDPPSTGDSNDEINWIVSKFACGLRCGDPAAELEPELETALRKAYSTRYLRRRREHRETEWVREVARFSVALGHVTGIIFTWDRDRNDFYPDPFSDPTPAQPAVRHFEIARELFGFFLSSAVSGKWFDGSPFVPCDEASDPTVREVDNNCPVC
jgi:hypothetical protein